MNYYAYIMTNKNKSVLYTGVTNNLQGRAYQHKQGLVDGFTQRYNVKELVYAQELKTPEEAIAAEKKIKGWTRAKKIALIESVNPEWNDLAEGLGEEKSTNRSSSAIRHSEQSEESLPIKRLK